MRRTIGRSVPMAALACALAVASLGGCSAADTAAGTDAGDAVAGAGGVVTGAAGGTSAAPTPQTSVTVDTTDVATDPPASTTSRGTTPAGRPGQPREVTVTTTYAGVLSGGTAVEVGGYVDVLESDGTCTLTLTRGSQTREVSAGATPDPTGTSCGGLAVALSELEAGTWQAVLSYGSSRATGTAPGVDVVVP